ncbi:MAG: zinc finger domain-containing protein [Nanoarchaeota archaeon]|nr:zinc finger domain-containing protein [Nanoarchaeota archaeon]
MSQNRYDEFGTKLVNDAADIEFDCPSCGKTKIGRSAQARSLGKEYTCPSCGFVGP